ncbi:izumo sperm-egg fusion protein 1-like isoform X4 [Limanda limanda]|uniref:izumo sperm-egg fusion protein 1-like isoform X4 n=1 Tax=Limanda limanda TaxID=27771 RepID=UPI0029C96479|nr:izumo sperm-egg fusion protein 1-like isoform X4 [Limanda limanda]
MLLILLGCVSAADTCLQCDPRVRVLYDQFVLSAPTVEQIHIKMKIKRTYEDYIALSRERKGVIDHTSMYRAGSEYHNEFNDFMKTHHCGTSEIIQIMEKGMVILEKHLDIFIRDGLCPNKCGLLRRRVMDCVSCRYKTYICPCPCGQQDCGETDRGRHGPCVH